MLKAFPYMGSKTRDIRHYRPLPTGALRVVEPFAGSCAYALNSGLPWLGSDVNADVVEIWEWLRVQTPASLDALAAWVAVQPPPFRVVKGGGAARYLCRAAVTLRGSSTSSVITALPHVRGTIAALPAIRRGRVVQVEGDALDYRDGDVVFIDPPYAGTRSNYDGRDYADDVGATVRRILARCAGLPTLVTYGEGAADAFPGLPWEYVFTKSASGGGTKRPVPRREYAAYLWWR